MTIYETIRSHRLDLIYGPIGLPLNNPTQPMGAVPLSFFLHPSFNRLRSCALANFIDSCENLNRSMSSDCTAPAFCKKLADRNRPPQCANSWAVKLEGTSSLNSDDFRGF